MSRSNDRVYMRHVSGTITADTATYFTSGSRPLMTKRSHLILVTAGSDEDETVDSDWGYNTDAAPTTWTNVIVAGATIDVGGSTLTAAALVTQDADAGADLNIRVPAGVSIRNNLDVAGTTPSFSVIAVLEAIPI